MPLPSLATLVVPLAAASLVLVGVYRASGGSAAHGSPTRGIIEPTATMRAARMAHTATALPDGRVLIAGGFTSEEHAGHAAEAYDPRTERFLALPRMHTMRHSHTATLLPGGKVLIAGGYAAGNATTNAAELFDPATNRFTPTGSLGASRAGHVAVLLGNGKVLVAGGLGPEWSFLSSAELYDPATGTFSPAGSMAMARESHVAVRLVDGRVLVVGGHRGRRADIVLYTSAEAYDPATNRFSPVGDMRVRRHKHDAVLLRDGRVLVTGGSDERDSRGVYQSTELFDPATGTFSPGPSMQRGRYKHQGSSIVLPNGTVLVAGGAPQAETFDPRSRTFTTVGGDARLSGQFSAVALLGDGRVLVAGGYGSDHGPRPSAWLYRP